MDGLYYDRVPKDPLENVRWRKQLLTKALDNPILQATLNEVCANDILFFFNFACWLFEPRPKKIAGKELPHIIPFITWQCQDKPILTMEENLGVRDMSLEKSRGQGASWILLMLFLNKWNYVPMSAFGLVSRNLDAVDNSDDPDSLFWKLDWELARLPKWMVGQKDTDYFRSIAKHSLKRPGNGSTIIGYSATGDTASGGRKTAFGLDELSKFPRGPDREVMDSTQHVTECRIVIATPKGSSGEYYEWMHDESSDLIKIILDWKDNSTQNRGLYRVVQNLPVEIDPLQYGNLPKEYREIIWWNKLRQRLEDKGYDLEKGLRSPWYDRQCLRPGATPISIAQELDRDYGGSVSRVFASSLIDRLLRQTARKPNHTGEIHFNNEDHVPRWSPSPSGKLRLWWQLDSSMSPPVGNYVVSADIAMGTGSQHGSNSTFTVLNIDTGVKMAEFASPRIFPQQLAHYAVALCKWFRSKDGTAKLIWETSGPGGQFTVEIGTTDFRNVWMKRPDGQFVGRQGKSPGFCNNSNEKKANLLGGLAHEMLMGRFINHSEEALRECSEYITDDTGKVVHQRAHKCTDPSGAKDNHGDRVIADALAAMLLQDHRRSKIAHKKKEVSTANSFAARKREHERRKRSQKGDQIWSYG